MENIQDDIDKFMDQENINTKEIGWKMAESNGNQEEENVEIYTETNEQEETEPRENTEQEDSNDNEVQTITDTHDTQDNQTTINNNYINDKNVQYVNGQMDREILLQGNEDSRSQRTEVKLPMGDIQGRVIKMQKISDQTDQTEMKTVYGNGKSSQTTEKSGKLIYPKSFGEVAFESPIFQNNMMLTENVRMSKGKSPSPYKPVTNQSNVSQKVNKNGQKMFQMNMNSFGIVDNTSNCSGAEKRFLKFLDINQIRKATMNDISYDKQNNEFMQEKAKMDTGDDDGFKTRIRKGKTLNVYIKNEQQKTQKKPTYIELLGRKVKEKTRNIGEEHKTMTVNNIKSMNAHMATFQNNQIFE